MCVARRYVVVTFDGFAHAFPGRTEGAAEHEAPLFEIALAHASVIDDEEGPDIRITTRRSAMAAFLGTKTWKLRCRDAAEKYAWLRALEDPLALYEGGAASEAASEAPPEAPAASPPEAPAASPEEPAPAEAGESAPPPEPPAAPAAGDS